MRGDMNLKQLSNFFVLIFGFLFMSEEFVKDDRLFDYSRKDEGYHSGKEWSGTDKALTSLALALQAMDYNSTRVGQRNPGKYVEENPLLGRHPSQAKLAGVTLATMLANLYIANKLPSSWRKLFETGWAGVEGSMVKHNMDNGLDVVRW